jgi:hypothetical protein
MEQTQRREERPVRPGRLRSALRSTAQVGVAAVACTLWIGLALPGLQLIPGVGDLANTSVAISLQSALLGIDDSSGPTSASVNAAVRALGLTPTQQLSHNLLRMQGASASGSLVTQLDPRANVGGGMAASQQPSGAPASQPQTAPRVVPPPPPPVQPPAAPKPPRVVVPVAPVVPTPPIPTPPPTLGAQAIAFTSTPPVNAVVGVTTYLVSAQAGSGLPVSFSADPSSSGVCTVLGAAVAFVGVGTCTIDANQAGNSSYHAAAQVQQSFTVGTATHSRSVQTINFASVPGAVVAGTTYVVAVAASSGLSVDLSATSDSTGVCSVVGMTVHLDGIGTCTIRASQPGDANYQAAPTVQQSFSVGGTMQTISFSSTPPSGAAVGSPSYTVAAAATSGLAVVFSADSSSAGVCTVSGSTVTPVGSGTCLIDANQFGDSIFQAAPQVQQSFTVGGGAPSLSIQSIHFSSTPPGGAVVGSSYSIAAAASSGLPVAFSAAGSSAGVCTVSGSTVSLVGVGTCTVDANQPGNGSYQPAPQVQQSFAVGKDPQTISFATAPPSSAVVGGSAYTVSATSTSGLAVAFSADASSAGVCTVSGSTVSLVGAGTCTVNADQSGNSTFQPAVQVQQSFAVTTASLSVQTINFTSTPPAGAVAGGSTYVVSATASSGLTVVFWIDSTSGGVCTMSGSTVSFIGAGTCTIDANQSGNGSYQAAPQAQQSFAVGVAAQTIGFNSTPPSPASVGGPDYVVDATATSGLAVVFSADPASAGVCTVSGSAVSLTGAGTCTVNANQPGDATHQAAPQVQQSFAVTTPSLSVQTITFTSTPPAGAEAGGTAYVVSATATSGLAVAFSIDAASAGTCTISGATVSFVGAGTCTIDANQSGNGSYQAAPQAQQSFAVGVATQTIGFTSTPPSPAGVGDPDYVVAATATSGLAVVFSADPTSAGVCAVSGSSVSLVGAGTCTVNADQPGDATHQAAPQVQQSFTVGAGPPAPSVQSISFTSTAPSGALVGGPTYTVTATASSGLAVVLSAEPASAGVCTISGSTVSFVGAGTCTIDANQPGNGSYQPAPQVQQSFAVGLATQTISFTSTPPAGAVAGGAGYTVSATATSGLPVAFSLSAGSSGVCTISGSTVSFVGSGTCTINANQSGNGSYQAAPQAQQSFTVAGSPPPKSPQTINFTSTAPAGAVAGGSTYTVTATASSGLPVAFSIAGPSAGVCTLSGSTVSFVGSGTCTINANQSGNGSYLAAPQAQQSFAVGLTPQTISFTSTPPAGAFAGGAGYTVSATATSGLPVAFSLSAGSAGVCTISGASVSFVGGGTCTINANQSGNGSYQAAPQAQQSFTVAGSPPPKSPQTINFTSTAPAGATVGGSAYHVTATASSGLAVAFSAAAASAGICTVSGSTVSLVGAGTCTINANQSGNGSYLAAPQVQQSFTISIASQTISFTSTPPGSAAVGSTYNVSATASSGLAVTFSADASSAGICTVSGSTVSVIGVGTCRVDANQAGNGNYQAAPQVQQSFAVGKASQTITFTSTPPANAVSWGGNGNGNGGGNGTSFYQPSATATSGLAVSFTIDPSSSHVCLIWNGIVAFFGHGTCVIYANQAGNANYLPAPQVQQVIAVA